MKKVEYGKMSREEREMLFEARLLPTGEVGYPVRDVRLTLDSCLDF